MEIPSILYTLSTLETARLTLRAFDTADASAISALANDRDIAKNLATLPHPYLPEMAMEWLATLPDLHSGKTHRIWAITLKGMQLIGAIGLHDVSHEHSNAELGYWLGKEYWGKGFATEAARAVAEYGLGEMSLERVYAKHFARNPQSERVLAKIGMQHEGVLRRHFCKWGEFQDCVMYGIVQGEL